MFIVGKNLFAEQKTQSSIFPSPMVGHCSNFLYMDKYRALETKVTIPKKCGENIKALGPGHVDTRNSSYSPNYTGLGESSQFFLCKNGVI